MRIITWNCCLPPWSFSRKRRIPAIISGLVFYNPDIICLQEVFFKTDAELICKGLKALGFRNFFHFKNLLIISKRPLLNKRGFVFKSQGNLLGWSCLDVLYGKGFELAQFEYQQEILSLVNTHLLSANASQRQIYQQIRLNQVQEICQLINGKAIMVGDFNFCPKTPPYFKIVNSGFLDPSDIELATVPKGKFDYIFIKGFFSKKAEPIFKGQEISDHMGLIIDI